jgi:ribosomal protein S18 acetylase RimI-like enzyme
VRQRAISARREDRTHVDARTRFVSAGRPTGREQVPPTSGEDRAMSRLIEISHRLPTVAEHQRLFERVGWPWYGDEAVRRALAGSSFGAVAVRGGEVVGMGRVVGDGSVFFYLQDLAVDPDVQRLGIGSSLVRALLSTARSRSVSTTFVGVFATPVAVDLYERHGFGPSELTALVSSGGAAVPDTR